jgi:hypothetical protein
MTNIDTQETDYSVYTWCVTVSVLSKTGKVEKTLISNALKKIGCKNTWEDFLEKLLDDENDALDKKNVNVTVSIDKK